MLLKKKWQNRVFWITAVVSGLVFAAGHLPSIMVLYGYTTLVEMSPFLLAEVFLLNGVLSVFAVYYMRKYGFLAAIGIHFWADVVWHVIWGFF